MVRGGWLGDRHLLGYPHPRSRRPGDCAPVVGIRCVAPALPPSSTSGCRRASARWPQSTDTLAGDSHQTWAYERAARVWRFDVFREPHDGDTWLCRRDTSIRRPCREVFEVPADGIPYLKPEICLLVKAKAVRDKDQADFEAALPRMSPTQRTWLHTALERVHPGQEWISATE
jgi:hypothetical protein